MNIGTDGPANTASANDIVFTQMYLNRATCLAINNLLGITNTGGEPPASAYTTGGQYVNGALSGSGIATGPEIDGKNAFCRKTTSASIGYQFIFVLVER